MEYSANSKTEQTAATVSSINESHKHKVGQKKHTKEYVPPVVKTQKQC